MRVQKENIQNKVYSDRFDIQEVSNLSLFLFTHQYVLMGRDRNDKISAIHQVGFPETGSLKDAIKSDFLFKMDVPTQVYVHNDSFSLVPGVLYDPSLDSAYLLFSGEAQENQQTFHSSFESSKLQLVGSLNQELFDLISENKHKISFHHGACSFLSFSLKGKTDYIDQEILVVIYDGFCYLSAFTNQELTLFNRFEVDNKEILLDYISGVAHQLSFNARHYRVSIFGETQDFGISSSWGEQYFWNFKLPTPSLNQSYHEGTLLFKESMLFESLYEFK
ncbi:DUF3822 family protein [Rhodonellum sp.]|uniref:DUF3822 family protein n=1 Tax=Rhodonellum sp. TaxID=2231180 RepID=UPI0027237C06|nr:DUF3822 family protein [Rhodonellum sp.]MDO9553207.1 DUF3822 family protein [Rhodonellum sp.]